MALILVEDVHAGDFAVVVSVAHKNSGVSFSFDAQRFVKVTTLRITVVHQSCDWRSDRKVWVLGTDRESLCPPCSSRANPRSESLDQYSTLLLFAGGDPDGIHKAVVICAASADLIYCRYDGCVFEGS